MDRATLHDREAELRSARVPFVHAQVVLAERPTSARPGDEALVLGDGTIEGFVGGECAEETVREQALALLRSGGTRLLRVTPEPEASGGGEAGAGASETKGSGRVVVHNPCLSGGSLEIFLEPQVPAPLLVIAGASPIAEALTDLAGRLGYEPVGFEGEVPADAVALVVASHGRDDEEKLLTAALRADVGYVGLVASPTRGAAVLGMLDLDADQRARVHTPAGIDIGARTPHEIALSILAEIIAARPRPRPRAASGTPRHEHHGPGHHGHGEATGSAAPTAVDPVCGMAVAMVESSLHLDRAGTRYWFCGSGCRRAFAADPEAFTA